MNKLFEKVFNYLKIRIFFIKNMHIYQMEELKYYKSRAIVNQVTNNNVSDISRFQDVKYIEVFKNFLSIGDIGYYGYLDDKCVHRSWVKNKPQVVFLNWAHPYILKDNEIYIHYCETSEEARGAGIYKHVLSVICKDNEDKNIILCIDDKNTPSKIAAKSIGFKEREKIFTLVLFGIKFKKILI